ncbi:MAG: dnaQ [Alphaproteobacteria bacterium]|jgi:DNA polymerase-3 subunit epsilon|nr:dnaQ [Alphaproteobacteria bacterium]
MREIVLDTETTGLDPASGHRIVEIGAVEMINLVPTTNRFQKYVNPERDMPDEARAVHGLSSEFLSSHPTFAEVASELLEFIGDAPLVIHNAAFDLGFLNAELARLGFPKLENKFVDTVSIARRRYPGAPASLDALCKRFEIDNSARNFHGALLDAQLLAEVYIELSGGKQADLGLAGSVSLEGQEMAPPTGPLRPARPHAATAAELAAHAAFLEKIKDPLWQKLASEEAAA